MPTLLDTPIQQPVHKAGEPRRSGSDAPARPMRYGRSIPHPQHLTQSQRLVLIRRLRSYGHPLGLLVRLSLTRLQHMLAPQHIDSAPIRSRALRVALVGPSLIMRLSSELHGASGMPACDVVRVCDSLPDAAAQLAGARADIVLIEVGEVSDEQLPLVSAAQEAAEARTVVVLYHFSASSTLERLRMQGCLLAREPVPPADVIRMCAMALSGRRNAQEAPAQNASLTSPRTPAPPLRFSQAALTAITAAATGVGCECPRHLAEILQIVGSFERYSQQCAVRNPQDAMLHQDLAHVTGQARALLEAAMEMLARAEGLPLPPPENRRG